jgi:hypothetical protein
MADVLFHTGGLFRFKSWVIRVALVGFLRIQIFLMLFKQYSRSWTPVTMCHPRRRMPGSASAGTGKAGERFT